MRTYICIYKDKKLTVEADSSYHAQQKAAYLFKAKKRWDVSVYLADVAIDPATL